MANHHHGLWGYSGTTAAGRELTIQATGIGGPSAARVLGELAASASGALIRIGTLRGPRPTSCAPGDRLVARRGARRRRRRSRALGEPGSRADAALAGALRRPPAPRPAAVASADAAGARRRPGRCIAELAAPRGAARSTSRPRRCWRSARGSESRSRRAGRHRARRRRRDDDAAASGAGSSSARPWPALERSSARRGCGY